METVQVVLEKELLKAADKAARQAKINRSALVRMALREHLRRLDLEMREERDRRGYLDKQQQSDEQGAWESEAAWPKE